jgi:hypothetical protein
MLLHYLSWASFEIPTQWVNKTETVITLFYTLEYSYYC